MCLHTSLAIKCKRTLSCFQPNVCTLAACVHLSGSHWVTLCFICSCHFEHLLKQQTDLVVFKSKMDYGKFTCVQKNCLKTLCSFHRCFFFLEVAWFHFPFTHFNKVMAWNIRSVSKSCNIIKLNMIWGVGETKTKNNNHFKMYVEGISLQEHPCDLLFTRIMSCVYI